MTFKIQKEDYGDTERRPKQTEFELTCLLVHRDDSRQKPDTKTAVNKIEQYVNDRLRAGEHYLEGTIHGEKTVRVIDNKAHQVNLLHFYGVTDLAIDDARVALNNTATYLGEQFGLDRIELYLSGETWAVVHAPDEAPEDEASAEAPELATAGA